MSIKSATNSFNPVEFIYTESKRKRTWIPIPNTSTEMFITHEVGDVYTDNNGFWEVLDVKMLKGEIEYLLRKIS